MPDTRAVHHPGNSQGFQDHQADGLQGWALPGHIRLIPVWRPAGGAALVASLACTWTLERDLRAEGYEVVVLDEALAQTPLTSLAQFKHTGPDEMLRQRLRQLPDHAVVLWLAPLDVLAVVLEGSPARPVLPFLPQTTGKRGVVDTYNAIKVLWQVGGLQALVLTPGGTPAKYVKALTDCCAGHLEMAPSVWALEYHDTAEMPRPAWHEASVWKVLDSAFAVAGKQEPQNDPQPCECPTPDARPYSRIADVYGQRYA